MSEEITLSHVLRSENSFTKDGLPYGAQIAKNLLDLRMFPDSPEILEIGPGLGSVAESINSYLERDHPEIWKELSYTMLEISEGLLKTNKSRFSGKKFNFIPGDALDLNRIKGRFNLVICNEVVGDLPTVENVDKNWLLNHPKGNLDGIGLDQKDLEIYKDSLRIMKQYKLINFGETPKKFNFNYGALKFLEEVKSILEPNGIVFIAENSCDNAGTKWPGRIALFGHNEYNVKFGFMEKVADALGFSVKSGSLTDFLGITDEKCISTAIQPELKSLYQFYKRMGKENLFVRLEGLALTIDEFFNLLGKSPEKNSVSDPEAYKKFLEKNAVGLKEITDQFMYLILKNRN
jgi:SAM-dependent methyltransferase